MRQAHHPGKSFTPRPEESGSATVEVSSVGLCDEDHARQHTANFAFSVLRLDCTFKRLFLFRSLALLLLSLVQGLANVRRVISTQCT
eukprot:6180971-Pleurochrysis_carterae.AAC.5